MKAFEFISSTQSKVAMSPTLVIIAAAKNGSKAAIFEGGTSGEDGNQPWATGGDYDELVAQLNDCLANDAEKDDATDAEDR